MKSQAMVLMKLKLEAIDRLEPKPSTWLRQKKPKSEESKNGIDDYIEHFKD
jgi:hypothetical protein